MSHLGPKTSNLDPVINYIFNGRAYNSTEGWATYADAAGAQPVDGTGGLPNVNWLRDTTTPLRQGSDFNFVKDAANRQGQGVSYSFTIDNADLAKVLTVTFDYEVLSGTYATGDLTVYLIQDPAGTPVVIQPAGYQIQSATVGTKMRQIATFQTASNVTSYRLCLHVATTSASAYSIAVDNVIVGPQVVQYGAAVTEWMDWTPTGTWVSNATYTGKYRIVGDIMEFKVNVACSGAVTAANLTVNLPSGFSIDTNKLVQFTAGVGSLGYGSALNAGVSFHGLLVNYNNTTSVGVYIANSAGTYISNANVSNTVPFTFGAADAVDLVFSAPILGLGATVQMSSDTDTRVVATRRTGPSATAFTADTLVTFSNTASPDTHGGWISSSEYRVPVPGVYKIGALFLTAGNTLSTTGAFQVFYRINNGASNRIGYVVGNGASNAWVTGGSDIRSLNAGDTITFRVSSSSTATVNDGYATVERLSGPSAIAASETVSLRANKTSGSHTSSGNYQTVAAWTSAATDSHGILNLTTGVITIPVAGTYVLCGQVPFTSNATGIRAVKFLVNGNDIGMGASIAGVAAVHGPVTSIVARLSAGDQVSLNAYQNSSGNLAYHTGDGGVSVSLAKVGL